MSGQNSASDRMNDDSVLILRARDGDMQAFEQLVFRHDRNVLSLAARYVTSAEDAKDIYQEVFLKVFRGLKKFRFECEFSTWIYRIAVNVCLTYRARSKRAVHIPLFSDRDNADDPSAVELPSGDRLPDRAAAAAEIADRIQRALGALSPQQRLVFALRHYEGHSLKEIAAILQCAEGTVKRYLFTAIRRLRVELKDLSDPGELS